MIYGLSLMYEHIFPTKKDGEFKVNDIGVFSPLTSKSRTRI